MKKRLIDYFQPELVEPADYASQRPSYPDAYLCASLAGLTRQEIPFARLSESAFQKAARAALADWGVSGASSAVFLNSRGAARSYPGAQALIVAHDATVFLAFRTTEPRSNDWLGSVNAAPKANPYGKGRVHAGFLSAFQALLRSGEIGQARSLIRSARQVWITGHGVGGALASIASAWLAREGTSTTGLYTFGAPRVGDVGYRDYVNQRLTYRYWRFLYGSDLAGDAPLRSEVFGREGNVMRLHNFGRSTLTWVDRNGVTHRTGRTFQGRTLKDHELSLYAARFLDVARVDTPDLPAAAFTRPL